MGRGERITKGGKRGGGRGEGVPVQTAARLGRRKAHRREAPLLFTPTQKLDPPLSLRMMKGRGGEDDEGEEEEKESEDDEGEKYDGEEGESNKEEKG